MNTRLLALALLVPASLFAIACGSDDTKDSQTVPSNDAQGVATQVSLPATPQLQIATPALTVLAAGTTPSATAASSTPRPPSGATPPVPSTASGSTISVPFPFENAVQARESLLGNARFGPPMDGLDQTDQFNPRSYPGWLKVYPSLTYVGASVKSTPSAVSIYRNLLQDKQPASASNPKLIVFAVMDTKGACAAGVIRGYPNYSDYASVDIGSADCTASSALAVLRK
jgi:hypothetical protein